MHYYCSSQKCDLCLAEKVGIARSEGVGLWNKQTEVIPKCQRGNKSITANMKYLLHFQCDWSNNCFNAWPLVECYIPARVCF